MSVLVYSMMLDGALSSNNRTLTSAFRAQTSRNLELLLATGLLNGDTLDDAHVLIRIIKSITYTPYKYTHKSAHVMTHVLVDAEFLLVFFLASTNIGLLRHKLHSPFGSRRMISLIIFAFAARFPAFRDSMSLCGVNNYINNKTNNSHNNDNNGDNNNDNINVTLYMSWMCSGRSLNTLSKWYFFMRS